jgi:hypothetical protein
VPVAHTCNPSYSGCRDQEDCGSKSARANRSVRPYLENPFTKIGLVEWLEFKPSIEKKGKKTMPVLRCSIFTDDRLRIIP